jgi:ribosome assembly protein YihI (activator of Der GTPase)
MVYNLLNDLQGILDAGRTLVKRNRQFVEEEANAISELEKNL